MDLFSCALVFLSPLSPNGEQPHTGSLLDFDHLCLTRERMRLRCCRSQWGHSQNCCGQNRVNGQRCGELSVPWRNQHGARTCSLKTRVLITVWHEVKLADLRAVEGTQLLWRLVCGFITAYIIMRDREKSFWSHRFSPEARSPYLVFPASPEGLWCPSTSPSQRELDCSDVRGKSLMLALGLKAPPELVKAVLQSPRS